MEKAFISPLIMNGNSDEPKHIIDSKYSASTKKYKTLRVNDQIANF
jgi:hypothetical protein